MPFITYGGKADMLAVRLSIALVSFCIKFLFQYIQRTEMPDSIVSFAGS